MEKKELEEVLQRKWRRTGGRSTEEDNGEELEEEERTGGSSEEEGSGELEEEVQRNETEMKELEEKVQIKKKKLKEVAQKEAENWRKKYRGRKRRTGGISTEERSRE